MMADVSRRQALVLGLGAVGIAASGLSPALAANDFADLIKAFTGGADAVPGKITLELPEIAENGNTVPISVRVDSPMTEDDHVASVLVVADGNPRGGVVTFHFTPLSGVAEANTRIRLASTQNIVAVARTSTGKLFTATRQVKVTIGGCGG